MRIWTIGTVAALALVAANLSPVSAADKPKDLIVGKWEAKPDDATVALEFTKDGKLKFTLTKGDQSETANGTYAVGDDDTLEVMLERNGEKHSKKFKIKVTKDEFVTTDDKNKVTTFKRPK